MVFPYQSIISQYQPIKALVCRLILVEDKLSGLEQYGK